MQPTTTFETRLRRISRKNRKLARGAELYVDATGIIKRRPKRQRLVHLPIMGLIYLTLGFILFKSIVLASIGAATYGDRLALLQEGSVFEQAGAWALQLDPMTRWLGALLGPLF